MNLGRRDIGDHRGSEAPDGLVEARVSARASDDHGNRARILASGQPDVDVIDLDVELDEGTLELTREGQLLPSTLARSGRQLQGVAEELGLARSRPRLSCIGGRTGEGCTADQTQAEETDESESLDRRAHGESLAPSPPETKKDSMRDGGMRSGRMRAMLAVMAHFAFASDPVGPVLLNLWERGATQADVEALERAIEAHAEAIGEPVAVLMVIPENTSLPDEGARRAAGTMIRRAAIRRVVVVIEGRGFGPGAMRSVFVGLGLIYKPGITWTVRASLDEAVDWLEGELGTPLERPALKSADGRLRAELGVAEAAPPSASGLFRRAR